jgi:hyperosmotically inducible protein
MNELNGQSPSSRKIIIAVAMAVVVGTGTVTFALRSHRPTAVAQIPAVPATVASTPEAAPLSAATPSVAGAGEQASDVPVSAAQRDRLGSTTGNTTVPAAGDTTPNAVEPEAAVGRQVAKAHTGVGTTNRTVTRAGSAVESSQKPAAETVGSNVDRGKDVDLPTTPSAPSGMTANASDIAMRSEPLASSSAPVESSAAPVASSTESAASDLRITTAVKSEIAADSSSKDANLGVTTTNGVVELFGSLADQDAIDHIKGVAEKVRDVKSVDTSALKITST